MITSLKVNGLFNIGVNSQELINVEGNNIKLSEIPFIRYNLDSYGTAEIEYIKSMMSKFSGSTHLIQVKLNENVNNSVAFLQTYASDILSKVAKFLYVDITSDEVINNCIDAQKLQNIVSTAGLIKFDRIMLVDNTTNLDMVHANRMRQDIAKSVNINLSKVGICSSPLCLEGELCCLTAVRARELISLYGNAEMALPTANHQCMNCCGCIRFFEINSDLEAPALVEKANTKKSADNIDNYMNAPVEDKKEKKAKEKKEKAPKKEKVVKEKIDKGRAKIAADKKLKSLF